MGSKPQEGRVADGTPKNQLIAAIDRSAQTFSLTDGNAHDAPEGSDLLEYWQSPPLGAATVMDRAYSGDETCQQMLDLRMVPVVPSEVNRLVKWNFDQEIYMRYDEVERLFRRLKGYLRTFSSFEQLDVMYGAVLNFALIVDVIES